MATISSNPVAGIIRRFMALVYDFFLMLGISFAYGVLVTLTRKALGSDTLQPASNLAELFILMGLWGCISSYYTWCWMSKGQTLGMKSWRLRLYNTKATCLTPGICIKRCLLATLLNSCAGFGLLWCLVDSDGDTLYDRMTGTRVERLPKN